MRISDWSSDVCSSDLHSPGASILAVASRKLGLVSLVWMKRMPSCSSTSYSRPDWRAETRRGYARGLYDSRSQNSVATRQTVAMVIHFYERVRPTPTPKPL